MRIRFLFLLLIVQFSGTSFANEISTESKQVDKVDVKTCDITIPDLGISNESVLNVLKEKGYQPIIANEMYLQGGGSKFVFGAAVKIMKPEYLHERIRFGTLYLELTLTTNGIVSQSQLLMRRFGDNNKEPLFVSEGYDSSLWPGHEDLFDASDFPSCD